MNGSAVSVLLVRLFSFKLAFILLAYYRSIERSARIGI